MCHNLMLVWGLQGKEDFERQQKALLEKENITQQSSKCQLGPDQVRTTSNKSPLKMSSGICHALLDSFKGSVTGKVGGERERAYMERTLT